MLTNINAYQYKFFFWYHYSELDCQLKESSRARRQQTLYLIMVKVNETIIMFPIKCKVYAKVHFLNLKTISAAVILHKILSFNWKEIISINYNKLYILF